jgi:N-acetyl-anhydromuramoyl-L-alanine amidase
MKFDSVGWLDVAERAPSPNFNKRPQGTPVDLLVIHCISLPEGQFGLGYPQDLFLNQLDPSMDPELLAVAHLKVSSHFLIDRQGAITQFVSVNDRAWHAGKSLFQGRSECNDFSVGIEMEGCITLPFESVQYEVLTQLTLSLFDIYPQLSPERIVGHSDIAPGRKQDPGPHFDWPHYRGLLGFMLK